MAWIKQGIYLDPLHIPPFVSLRWLNLRNICMPKMNFDFRCWRVDFLFKLNRIIEI